MQGIERHGQIFDLIEARRQGALGTGCRQAQGLDALQYGQIPVLLLREDAYAVVG